MRFDDPAARSFAIRGAQHTVKMDAQQVALGDGRELSRGRDFELGMSLNVPPFLTSSLSYTDAAPRNQILLSRRM